MEPVGEARNDFEIFADIADYLGFGDEVHRRPGRGSAGYSICMTPPGSKTPSRGLKCPIFRRSGEAGDFEFSRPDQPVVLLESFRKDPTGETIENTVW